MSDEIIRLAKVAQWGNSAAIRLGGAVLQHAKLQLNDEVEVVATEGEITIRRQRPKVTMAELLKAFDPAKHRHELVFDVEPAGNETR